MVATAHARGFKRIIVEEADTADSALIADLEVIPVKKLASFFDHLSGHCLSVLSYQTGTNTYCQQI